jgi:dTDP-4-dehydrorhamnose reductase
MTNKISQKIIYKYPKILLTGGTGQVGQELRHMLQPLGEVWSPNRKYFNLAESESLRQKIRDYQPDLIVNTAAYTEVDQVELNSELAYSVNVESPRILAEEACNLKIPLIHYSTDYVFDGIKREPYTESDKTNPINVYGKTKLEGEMAIQESHGQYLILRTSWVYNLTRGRNFYTTMLRLFQEKEVVRVIDDQIGKPTSAKFLAQATVEILLQLRRKEEGENRWGVYHIAGKEQMSWYGFATKIYKEVESESKCIKTKMIIPISSEEYGSNVDRPCYSVLNCERIQKKFENIYKKY